MGFLKQIEYNANGVSLRGIILQAFKMPIFPNLKQHSRKKHFLLQRKCFFVANSSIKVVDCTQRAILG